MPKHEDRTEEQLAKEAAMEFTIACTKREKDPKVIAKALGMGKKTTKEELTISQVLRNISYFILQCDSEPVVEVHGIVEFGIKIPHFIGEFSA